MTKSNTMQQDTALTSELEARLLQFLKKLLVGRTEKEVREYSKEAAEITHFAVDNSLKLNVKQLEKQAVENIKGELTTKDFVRAEIQGSTNRFIMWLIGSLLVIFGIMYGIFSNDIAKVEANLQKQIDKLEVQMREQNNNLQEQIKLIQQGQKEMQQQLQQLLAK